MSKHKLCRFCGSNDNSAGFDDTEAVPCYIACTDCGMRGPCAMTDRAAWWLWDIHTEPEQKGEASK